MPSASPGHVSTSPSPFAQILPGAPANSLQAVACFSFRQRHYVAYISGQRLNILLGPYALIQCSSFPQTLIAVAADPRTGRLAVASVEAVYVVVPVTEGWNKVSWETTLSLRQIKSKDEPRTLSWGVEDEVLVGGNTHLSLYSTLPSSRGSAVVSSVGDKSVEDRRPLWSIPLASPVQHAAFSPSATLVASCGVYDRLVKIWRRLSFEEGLFDHIYIPHPATVTSIKWRPSQEPPAEESDDETIVSRVFDDSEILYTIATDGILRIWKTSAAHDLEILVLHNTLDLVTSIPESPSLTIKDPNPPPRNKPPRFTCILPSDQFSVALNTMIGLQDVRNKHSSEHLRVVSSKEPDVVVSFDGKGRMSAWGLQSIGHKRRPDTPSDTPTPPFFISHAEDLAVRIPADFNTILDAWLDGSVFNLVGHSLKGEITWWRDDSGDLFSPSNTTPDRLSQVAYWSGHTQSQIAALAASPTRRALLSFSTHGELVFLESSTPGTFQQSASYVSTAELVDIALIRASDKTQQCFITVEKKDAQDSASIETVLRDAQHGHEIARVQQSPQTGNHDGNPRLFLSTDRALGNIQVVQLNEAGKGSSCVLDTSTRSFGAPKFVSLPAIKSGDPVQHLTAIVDSAELGRFGVVAVTKSGVVMLFHVTSAEQADLETTLIATFQTSLVAASLLASNNDFAAIVSENGSEVGIVNLTDGYVEHRIRPGQSIRRVLPSPTESLIAVADDVTIDIFAQGRIGYREEMPPWVAIKQISVAGLGLTISALTWLSDGSLAVAAGGCVFLSSNEVDVDDLDADVREATGVDVGSPQTLKMSTVAKRLRQPIPVWHPTFVAHIVRFGQWSLAASLVARLLQKLKFWSEGEILPPLLNVPATQLYGAEGIHDEKALDRELVNELNQQLLEKDLPGISHSEQRRLECVLEAMTFCSEHVKGLDNLALRYLYSWKFELLLAAKDLKRNSQPDGVANDKQPAVPQMHWREVAFAFHSTSQQPLLDILMFHYDNKITWNIAKQLGLFAWLSDREALDQIFEALAQTAYRSTSPPDPINASLYFLALHKKQTLLGLWRIATWHKEQRATMNFLRRDFTQPANQTAAKKNAYALMGKRRFEYAAAFFLLADDGASAVSVLAGQCGDVMLAIAVGRLYSGNTSPAIQKLIQDRLIPEATRDNDRWLLNWCHSLLRQTHAAAFALVKPLHGVRGWHQDDPAVLNLYQRLRKENSEYEFDAVLRAARILRRMGLWLIALELVSQWEFKRPEVHKYATRTDPMLVNGVDNSSVPSMLDGFVDAPPATDPSPIQASDTGVNASDKETREAKAAELLKRIQAKKLQSTTEVLNEKRPPPTQFKEPDAKSLLDSFGL